MRHAGSGAVAPGGRRSDFRPIRVLIVDDHELVREGLKRVLSDTGDIVAGDAAGNVSEAIEKARRGTFDVVLTDISMPGRDGLDLIRDLRRESPHLPIVVLTVHGEEQFAVRALKAGASGYLMKDSPVEELIEAVRRVAAGGRYLSHRTAEHLAAHLGGSGLAGPDRLSNREFQVLRLLASGLTVTEIGDHLSLSLKTISTYRTRLLQKLGMKTSAELMAYAIRNGLIE